MTNELGYTIDDAAAVDWPTDQAGDALRIDGAYVMRRFGMLPGYTPPTHEGYVREVRMYLDGAIVVTFEPRSSEFGLSEFAFTVDLTDVTAEFTPVA